MIYFEHLAISCVIVAWTKTRMRRVSEHFTRFGITTQKVLLEGRYDVYTLVTQMGTSVKMIEQHYGHLTATLRADVIAGKRFTTTREEE